MKFQLVVSRFAEKGRPAELRLQPVGDSRFVQVSTPGDSLKARLVKDIKLSSCLLVSDIYLKALFAPTFKEAEPAHVRIGRTKEPAGCQFINCRCAQAAAGGCSRCGHTGRVCLVHGCSASRCIDAVAALFKSEPGTLADVFEREEEEGGK